MVPALKRLSTCDGCKALVILDARSFKSRPSKRIRVVVFGKRRVMLCWRHFVSTGKYFRNQLSTITVCLVRDAPSSRISI